MVQIATLILLIIAEGVLVYYNVPSLDSTVTIVGPGTQVTASYLVVAASIAAAFALMWLAGVADRVGLERRVRQRDTTLHAMGEEMLRMKSTAYDQERPPLADIRVRLETMERDLRAIRLRLGDGGTGSGDRQQTQVAAGERWG